MLTFPMHLTSTMWFAGSVGGAEGAADDQLRSALAGAAAGNGDDLARLYELSARDLFGLALWKAGDRGVAEDAVQEVFCRIGTGQARPPSKLRNPKAWLLTCARNVVVDLERRRRCSGTVQMGIELFELATHDAGHRAEVLDLSAAVKSLPGKLREAVYLHVYVGLSFREIGIVLRVPTFTAASRYRLAVQRLETLLGGRP